MTSRSKADTDIVMSEADEDYAQSTPGDGPAEGEEFGDEDEEGEYEEEAAEEEEAEEEEGEEGEEGEEEAEAEEAEEEEAEEAEEEEAEEAEDGEAEEEEEEEAEEEEEQEEEEEEEEEEAEEEEEDDQTPVQPAQQPGVPPTSVYPIGEAYNRIRLQQYHAFLRGVGSSSRHHDILVTLIKRFYSAFPKNQTDEIVTNDVKRFYLKMDSYLVRHDRSGPGVAAIPPDVNQTGAYFDDHPPNCECQAAGNAHPLGWITCFFCHRCFPTWKSLTIHLGKKRTAPTGPNATRRHPNAPFP
ncbi:hypothetical protein FN846DRAFT_893706 [Sphaerosporella brunnea]|uniref:Uncharacterized protein n=1 Tax=Sphaerosporella brunnea TaxID=1250544 RepID=A0A5J5EL73_9PEZI|nr:hypothetical protein FN846DRAFT_893706 [Sphaerosporella brunnea]